MFISKIFFFHGKLKLYSDKIVNVIKGFSYFMEMKTNNSLNGLNVLIDELVELGLGLSSSQDLAGAELDPE